MKPPLMTASDIRGHSVIPFITAAAVISLATSGCEDQGLNSSGCLPCPPSPGATVAYPMVLPEDDSSIPQPQRDAYRVDAARLAARWLDEVGTLQAENVDLPASLVQSIYSSLVRVYRSRLPARDSVTSFWRIHTFPYPDLHRLIVGVDTTKSWVDAWRRGRRFTGNPVVDRVLERYDLHPEVYHTWSFGHAVVLRSSRLLNMRALAGIFERIDGVRYAEPDNIAGDGNDIRAGNDYTSWSLSYSLGWGDCPAGCIERRYWNFKVYANGFVEYTGGCGSPPPGER